MVVSGAIVSVWAAGGLLTAACVRFSVTPAIALVTVLVELEPLTVPILNCASCAAVDWLQLELDGIVEPPPLVLGVEVTLSCDRPLSVLALAVTLMVLAAPLAFELSTRCAPSLPFTMVADTPGLFGSLLIASRMPASVLFDELMLIVELLLPTCSVRLPVPSWVVAPKAGEDSDCDWAICETVTW